MTYPRLKPEIIQSSVKPGLEPNKSWLYERIRIKVSFYVGAAEKFVTIWYLFLYINYVTF